MELSESLISGVGVHIDEALATGGEVTVIGLAIVFAVLVILMIVLMLFKVFFYKPAKISASPANTPIQASPAEPVQAAAAELEEEDDEELIAVLTAAVAASMNTSTYNLKIKSYRRIPNTRPAWNRAGISDTIGNRF